jgi:hypothetical protein
MKVLNNIVEFSNGDVLAECGNPDLGNFNTARDHRAIFPRTYARERFPNRTRQYCQDVAQRLVTWGLQGNTDRHLLARTAKAVDGNGQTIWEPAFTTEVPEAEFNYANAVDSRGILRVIPHEIFSKVNGSWYAKFPQMDQGRWISVSIKAATKLECVEKLFQNEIHRPYVDTLPEVSETPVAPAAVVEVPAQAVQVKHLRPGDRSYTELPERQMPVSPGPDPFRPYGGRAAFKSAYESMRAADAKARYFSNDTAFRAAVDELYKEMN